MMIASIDQKASRAVPILVAIALSSLATTWALNTPELSKKAETAQVLETKVIPKLKDAAGCQTARARVATNLAKASEKGHDIDLTDIPNCPLAKSAAAIRTVTAPQ